jgi:GNAT superfamily N-acetyltransferase
VAVSEVALALVELAHLDGDVAEVVAERLATWHVAEWGHLYDPGVWNLDVARHEFAEQRSLGGGHLPTTYVALAPDGLLLGSVSLVPSDDLDGFQHVGPWLASLYVDEPWRRRGLGRRLVQHLLDQSPARRAAQVYLFTADHVDWYTDLGWTAMATTTSGPHEHPVTVMVRPS